MRSKNKTNQNRLAFTIYADVGMAPWGWVKSAEDMTRYVGRNCADSTGWHAKFKISKQLESEFVNWAVYFDSQPWFSDESIYQTFDWANFNAKGIELSKRLKKELGDLALVYYARPSEENHISKARIEILSDGDIRSFDPID